MGALPEQPTDGKLLVKGFGGDKVQRTASPAHKKAGTDAFMVSETRDSTLEGELKSFAGSTPACPKF